MEAKTNYTFVGITVLLLTTALIIALIWLSVGFERKSYHTYLVYLHESAAGLTEDAPVKFNGVKVGQVKILELNPDNPQEITLTLQIDANIPITVSTRATLITQGFTGSTYLSLYATTPTLTLLTKKLGQSYPIIPYRPSFLNQLESNLNEVSSGLKRIFTNENTARVNKILTDFEQISGAISRNSASIDKTLINLPLALKQFDLMSQRIAASSIVFNTTLNSGKNTLEQLNLQAIPALNELLDKLNRIATNFEQTSKLIKQNPAVIIRGTIPPLKGPGE